MHIQHTNVLNVKLNIIDFKSGSNSIHTEIIEER